MKTLKDLQKRALIDFFTKILKANIFGYLLGGL